MSSSTILQRSGVPETFQIASSMASTNRSASSVDRSIPISRRLIVFKRFRVELVSHEPLELVEKKNELGLFTLSARSHALYEEHLRH
jgi:hypothetical protein